MPDIRRTAAEPEDPTRLFVDRANDRDVDGLVALYEAEAVVADNLRATILWSCGVVEIHPPHSTFFMGGEVPLLLAPEYCN